MSFLAYELAVNPHIQKRLFKEIQTVNAELDGNPITYDQIQGMKYLDQAVSETLRKWPAAAVSLCFPRFTKFYFFHFK